MDNEPEEAGQQDWVATRSGEADTQNNSLGWSTANIPVRTGTKPTEQKMMSAKGSSTFQRGPQWAWHVKSFQQVYSWQATPAVPTGVKNNSYMENSRLYNNTAACTDSNPVKSVPTTWTIGGVVLSDNMTQHVSHAHWIACANTWPSIRHWVQSRQTERKGTHRQQFLQQCHKSFQYRHWVQSRQTERKGTHRQQFLQQCHKSFQYR